MDEEILKKLFWEDPMKLISLLENNGVDMEQSTKELDIARKMVQERYPMDDKNIRAVEFVFWLAYFLEREIQSIIIGVEVKLGARYEALEKIVDKLHFGDKIELISNLYTIEPKKDALIKISRKIQGFRNDVAHGRFDKLVYESFNLSDLKGQIKIFVDLKDALMYKNRDKSLSQT